MNIKLLIENQHPLVLGDNVNVQLVRQNNFWREQVEFSFEYSLPFQLPYCDINAQLLGFPENINSRKRVAKPVSLMIKNTLRMRGQLIVLESSYEGYTVALVKRASYDLDKKLSEVISATYPTYDLEVDIPAQLAKTYADGQDFNWPQIANLNEQSVQNYPLNQNWFWTYINYYHGTSQFFGNDSPITPQFYLVSVVRELSKFYSWKIISPWLNSAKVVNKLIFNTTFTTPTISDRYFKPFLLTNNFPLSIYLGVETDYVGGVYVNFVPKIGDTVTIVIYRYNATTLGATGTTTVSYTVTAPDVASATVFLTNLANAIIAADPNYTILNTQFGIPNPGINLMYIAGGVGQFVSTFNTLPAPEIYDKIYQKVQKGSYTYLLADIQMSKHLPDITVADFFNALREAFNLSISFDFKTEQVFITPKRDLLSWRTIDLTEYILAYPVTSEVELPVYKLIYEVDEFEVYTLSDLSYYSEATEAPGYLLEKGTTDIQPALGRVFAPAFGFPNGNGGAGPMPITEQPIGSYTEPASNPFRLMTWKGLQPDSLGHDYPRADMDDLNPDELYAEYYDAWVRYTTSDPRRLRARFNIPFEVLNTIDPLLRWRISGINHIWVEVIEKYTATDIEVEALLARI